MRLRAALLYLGCLCSLPVFAVSFQVEVGCFDWRQGPLTMTAESSVPLPDGCLGQVLVDVAGDGINSPQPDGAPGAGDARFGACDSCGLFRVNGAARLSMPGAFLADPRVFGYELPAQQIFMRVWNHADPAQATYYYDSPLYLPLPGYQQMSFAKAEFAGHAFGGTPGTDYASLPANLGVLGVYPNPFNARTRVVFELTEAAEVHLNVHDLGGRLIRTLTAGELPAGRHERTFDAQALPSGLYFLSLDANSERRAVRKLLLVR